MGSLSGELIIGRGEKWYPKEFYVSTMFDFIFGRDFESEKSKVHTSVSHCKAL
jgi:hypothetical protein